MNEKKSTKRRMAEWIMENNPLVYAIFVQTVNGVMVRILTNRTSKSA